MRIGVGLFLALTLAVSADPALELERGNYAAALREAQAGVQAAPANAHTHVMLGRVLGRLGRVEEAADQFEAALQLAPEDPEVYLAAGQCFVEHHLYEPARELFEVAQRLAPESAAAQAGIGATLRKEWEMTGNSNRLFMAVTAYEKALALPTSGPPEYAAYAECALERLTHGGDRALERRADLLSRQAVERFPQAGLAYYARARLARHLGRSAEADQDFRKALELGVPFQEAAVCRTFVALEERR